MVGPRRFQDKRPRNESILERTTHSLPHNSFANVGIYRSKTYYGHPPPTSNGKISCTSHLATKSQLRMSTSAK